MHQASFLQLNSNLLPFPQWIKASVGQSATTPDIEKMRKYTNRHFMTLEHLCHNSDDFFPSAELQNSWRKPENCERFSRTKLNYGNSSIHLKLLIHICHKAHKTLKNFMVIQFLFLGLHRRKKKRLLSPRTTDPS